MGRIQVLSMRLKVSETQYLEYRYEVKARRIYGRF